MTSATAGASRLLLSLREHRVEEKDARDVMTPLDGQLPRPFRRDDRADTEPGEAERPAVVRVTERGDVIGSDGLDGLRHVIAMVPRR